VPDETDALELAKAVADEVRDGIILCDHCGKAEVAVLLADRRTDAEIAAALGISWHTVRSHVERIFRALQCHTRREAATKLRSPT
jgi:ATP/maltotriose-dependent transcriptional regulator MalT